MILLLLTRGGSAAPPSGATVLAAIALPQVTANAVTYQTGQTALPLAAAAQVAGAVSFRRVT